MVRFEIVNDLDVLEFSLRSVDGHLYNYVLGPAREGLRLLDDVSSAGSRNLDRERQRGYQPGYLFGAPLKRLHPASHTLLQQNRRIRGDSAKNSHSMKPVDLIQVGGVEKYRHALTH